jgi:G3E family GTPase
MQEQDMQEQDFDPNHEPDIPVTILTGFLGAGKTTLLNRILTEDHKHKIAVIENEFGETGIDNELLVRSDKDQIVQMNNGCICCTIRGDLSRILTDLRHRKEKGEIDFDYVVIETTGVANPGPVCQTFFLDDVVACYYRLDGVVTIVDAKHGMQTMDEQPEVKDQIGFADKIFVSKTDLVTAEEYEKLRGRIVAMNPRAPIKPVNMGNVPVGEVLNLYGFNMNDVLDVDPEFLTGAHKHNHDDAVAAFVWESDKPIEPRRFEQFMQSLVNVYGPDMLRYKGLLYVQGSELRVVFQGVHQIFSADAVGRWGEKKPVNRIVVIGRNLPREAILKGFDSCLA